MKKKFLLLAFILFFLILFSSFLDLPIATFFFQNQQFSTAPFYQFLYHYGILPAWILAGISASLLICSFFKTKLARYRSLFAYLILVLALGSGVVIHGILKENWGRPRPRQVEAFGGQSPYTPFYQPNFSVKAKSFPSGHASMGFYFFSLVFLGRCCKNKTITSLGWGLAIILGGLLSLARIAQGGHFFTDTLFSALIMWGTAWALAVLLLNNEAK